MNRKGRRKLAALDRNGGGGDAKFSQLPGESEMDWIMRLTNDGMARDWRNRGEIQMRELHEQRKLTEAERSAIIDETRTMQERGELPESPYQYVKREGES